MLYVMRLRINALPKFQNVHVVIMVRYGGYCSGSRMHFHKAIVPVDPLYHQGAIYQAWSMKCFCLLNLELEINSIK